MPKSFLYIELNYQDQFPYIHTCKASMLCHIEYTRNGPIHKPLIRNGTDGRMDKGKSICPFTT